MLTCLSRAPPALPSSPASSVMRLVSIALHPTSGCQGPMEQGSKLRPKHLTTCKEALRKSRGHRWKGAAQACPSTSHTT